MVQLQELRKGNILEVDGQYIKVSHFDNDAIYEEDEFNDVGAFDIQECHPVLLTDEIIKECGFEQSIGDENEYFIRLNYGPDRLMIKKGSVSIVTFDSKVTISWYKHIKSLHQLQNLYFALTGEELKINP